MITPKDALAQARALLPYAGNGVVWDGYDLTPLAKHLQRGEIHLTTTSNGAIRVRLTKTAYSVMVAGFTLARQCGFPDLPADIPPHWDTRGRPRRE